MASLEPICPQCSEIFSGESYIRTYTHELGGSRTNKKPSFHHHADLSSFESALNAKCPICFRVSLIHANEYNEDPSKFSTRYQLYDDFQNDKLELRILTPNNNLTRFTLQGTFSRPPFPEKFRLSPQLQMEYGYKKSKEANRYREEVWQWYKDTNPRIDRTECTKCREARSLQFHPNTCSPTMQCAMRFWLSMCESSHSNCRFTRPQSPLPPTRLIHIGNTDKKHLQLQICANEMLDQPQYVTLSYRWGNLPFLNLTSSNIEKFCSGLPLEDLPQLFRDAVFLTKMMKIQYIWIDALCIIQDSEKDWEKESERMSNVYRNGFFNIVAAYSDGPQESLFSNRNPTIFEPFQVHTSWTHEYAPNAHFQGYESDSALKDAKTIPLFERGWVFQERLLSPRLLIFTKNQCYWKCRSSLASEAVPFGDLDADSHGEAAFTGNYWISTLEIFSQGRNFYPTPFGPQEDSFASLWRNLLIPFMKCQLTYSTDRLAAIGGISRFMQEKTGNKYLAGIWRDGLLQMLCWRVKGHGPYARQFKVAPSWSWASISDHDAINFDAWITEDFVTVRPLASLVHREGEMQPQTIRNNTENSTTVCLDGELIKARLRYQNETNTANKTTVETNSHRGVRDLILDSEESLFNTLRFDDGSNVCKTVEDMYLFPLILQNGFSLSVAHLRLRVFGLILERHEEGGNAYRRIGCFLFSNSSVSLVGINLEKYPRSDESEDKDDASSRIILDVGCSTNGRQVLYDRPMKSSIKLV